MDDINAKLKNTLESILGQENFNSVIKIALKTKLISKDNLIISVVILIILLPIIKKIGFMEDTIMRFTEIVETSKDFTTNLFGILFTGYGLFQAFTNGELIKKLLINDGKKKSLFVEYNIFFFKTCIMYLIMIVINYILLLILKNISKDFSISMFTDKVNNIIATILIAIYFFANIYLILEVKSLLYNIYQAFNMNALNEGINVLKNSNNKI